MADINKYGRVTATVADNTADAPRSALIKYGRPEEAFEFSVGISHRYPFEAPTWRWRYKGHHHRCLGPGGAVSVDALTHWTAASSLASVLIELFPELRGEQGDVHQVALHLSELRIQVRTRLACCTVHVRPKACATQHGIKRELPPSSSSVNECTTVVKCVMKLCAPHVLRAFDCLSGTKARSPLAWRLQGERQTATSCLMHPCVLNALAAHLLQHAPTAAAALHLTCRAAAAAVKDATTSLTIRSKRVDFMAMSHNFRALEVARLSQCDVACDVRSSVACVRDTRAVGVPMTTKHALLAQRRARQP